ncbi:MAG: RIP metalloprotease RseP [Clostridiales bacterium]|nr:RIP metalloprotease RseP [Clostridiales bacterium]MCF8022174.1 RIP metalloprotease RseP [Clostridiales bacterium]
MTTFLSSVIVFGMLIFFHELGHFTIAKLTGVQVHEFSLGFGPRLVGFRKSETNYNIRIFPLGGFVKMAGMDPEEESIEEGRGFNDKTVLQRAGVIFAGPFMNFILAIVLFASIFIIQGIPVPSTTVSKTVADDPAEEAGIKSGDRIVAIEGQRVDKWEDITRLISKNAEEDINITINRDGNNLILDMVPAVGDDGQGHIGIYPENSFQRQNPFSALVQGTKFTGQITFLIVDFLGKMITGEAPADLGGPVRVVYEINKATDLGMAYLFRLAAFLSINLGLFNLFPIPALDGSRIMFLALEGIRGKPLDPAKENFIHMVGFGLLLMLIVFITYNDILQLFTVNKSLP